MSSEVLWALPTLFQQTVSNYFLLKAATDKLLMIPLGSLTSGTLRIISLEFESGHFFFFLLKKIQLAFYHLPLGLS